jgi:hypothetical protein
VQNGEQAPRAHLHRLRELLAVDRAAGLAWAFVASRRWLLGAMLATCGLLCVLSLGQTKHSFVVPAPDLPEEKFDDVTNLASASAPSGSWLHRWLGGNEKPSNQVPGLTLGVPPADDSEPPETSRLTRRLDAVRSRQGKGAVLTGTIDPVNTSARQYSNAPLRPPAQVQAPQTADSNSNTRSTPESVFR